MSLSAGINVPLAALMIIACVLHVASCYNVLLATMGGTKSHTVPFVALGTELKSRGHNVTMLSAFSGPAANNDLQELVPPNLEVKETFFFFFLLIFSDTFFQHIYSLSRK